MDLLDLCSIAETCSRFHQVVQRIFPWTFALEKNDFFTVASERYCGQQLRQCDLSRVMANFGSIVSDFSISARISRCRRDRCSLDYVLMEAVARNFFDNLKCLRFYGFKMPATCTDKIREIFKRLQILDLQWVSTSDPTLFEGLNSLVELRVIQVESCSAILDKVFPRLERLTYFTTDIRMSDAGTNRHAKLGPSFDTLMTFIARHSGLKAIDFCFYSHPSCLMVLLEAIGNTCKNLVELWIRAGLSTFTSAHLQSLQKFESLRMLGLWEVPCGNFQFIAERNELRELHLCGCLLPANLNHFDALDRLTKLVIDNCTLTDPFDIVHMIGRLQNLEELAISWLYIQSIKFKLDKNTYNRIVNTVTGRAQVLTLNCEFYFDLMSSEMCPKILLFYYIGD